MSLMFEHRKNNNGKLNYVIYILIITPVLVQYPRTIITPTSNFANINPVYIFVVYKWLLIYLELLSLQNNYRYPYYAITQHRITEPTIK